MAAESGERSITFTPAFNFSATIFVNSFDEKVSVFSCFGFKPSKRTQMSFVNLYLPAWFLAFQTLSTVLSGQAGVSSRERLQRQFSSQLVKGHIVNSCHPLAMCFHLQQKRRVKVIIAPQLRFLNLEFTTFLQPSCGRWHGSVIKVLGLHGDVPCLNPALARFVFSDSEFNLIPCCKWPTGLHPGPWVY